MTAKKSNWGGLLLTVGIVVTHFINIGLKPVLVSVSVYCISVITKYNSCIGTNVKTELYLML